MKNIITRMAAGFHRFAVTASALAVTSFSLVAAMAAPANLLPGFPALAFKGRARGEAAITALGNNRAAVAEFYRMTDAKLQRILRQDKMLWIDERGLLLYICEFDLPRNADEALAADVSPIDNGPVDRSQTFLLHSHKGASKIVYLDFDGHDASTTQWGQDAIAVPFDLDGNESNFSTTERDRIQYIWQRVAEDYAIYDIDITTEDPGVEALRKSASSDTAYGIRVVIGGASGDWYGSAGGVAYVGSFDWNSDTPCWVFPGSLGQSEKNIAEAISHEVGHTLALNHDGQTDGTSYYYGHGNWAPIMGVGYNEPIVQWSKGEYNLANNTEDDLAKMLTEGIAYRTDDHGNAISTATLLKGVTFTTEGVIERNTDLDFFRFQTGAGRAILTATPSPRGPNLHLLLSLYDSAGNLLISTNVLDTTAGVLPVTISTNLPTGTYYFSVDGIGQGNPANTGYSEYASLGQYIIRGTLIPDTSWLPVTAGVFSWTNTANWVSNNVPDAADVVARLNNNIIGDQVVSLDKVITVGSLILGDTNGTHAFTLQTGDGGPLIFSKTAGSASLIKNTGLNDLITANILLLSDLVVSNSSTGDLAISSPITGTGGVTKTGAGNLIFDGEQDYFGPTVVAGGKIQLTGTASLPNSPKVEISAGATFDASALLTGWIVENNRTLSGSGIVLGDVAASSGVRISPGDVNVGTLSLSNNLVLNSGAILNFDLSNSDAAGDGTNDLLVVGGDLSLNSPVTLSLSFSSNFPASPGSYTLIRYGGALFGSATDINIVNLTTRFTFEIDTSVPGEIRLNVSGASGSLVWQGDALFNQWDLSASNWRLAGSPSAFAHQDDVLFDDNGFETPALNISTMVQPASVSVVGAKNYTFSGGGKISGATGITKQGSGTLTLNAANDFNGAVSVIEGTLKTGNASALGNAVGPTTVSSGARLDLNAQNLGAELVGVGGSGLLGTGALINSSGAAQSNALRFVTLSADTTFGGNGRWDVRANPTATFAANGFALTKTGLNDVWLADVGATGLGDINVNQGLFGVQGTTTLGNAGNTLTAASGARIGIWNSDINVLNKRWALNGATVQSLAGNNAIAGTMTLNGINVFSSVSLFNVQTPISGAGSLVKTGNGALTLSGANSFAGNLTVSTGTLIAGNAGALGNTNGGTIIANEARLDINGYNLGAESVIAQGNGLGNAGAIINSGASQTSALRFVTLSSATTFGGIGRWDIRANPTGNLIGNNFSLTKTGGNTVYLVDLGNTGLGNITVADGTLGFQGNSTAGNSASTLAVGSGATLGIFATGTNVLSKVLTMSTAKINNGSGSNTFMGATTLSASNAFDMVSSTSLTMGGNIGGSGSLWKTTTTGALILTGTNSYSGVTVVAGGILQIGNGGRSGTLGTGSVTNNASLVFNRTNDFSVANLITGTGGITQNGSGTVTLSGNSSYSGSTIINSGTIAVGNDTAIGRGVLNFNGNDGGFRSANISTRTLTNDLVFGGTAVRLGSAGTGDLVFNGAGANNGTLTKTIIVSNANTTINNFIANRGAIVKDGPGALILGGANTYTNMTTVLAGTLRINAENRLGLNPAAFNPAQLTLNGGTLQSSTTFAFSDANRGITLGVNGGTINVNAGTTLTLTRPVTGIGNLTKTGAGTLLFTAANGFAGNTVISSGSLALSGAGALVSTPSIDVGAGSIFDVSSLPNFAIRIAQTLSGLGTVNGSAQIDGIISPGGPAGRLSFNNELLLRGMALVNLNKTSSSLTNDFLAVNGSLSLGGILMVSSSGDALASGDTFRLFSAGLVSDSFSNVLLPVLAAGLTWDQTGLAVDGTLRVIPASLQILPATSDGTNLFISVQSEPGLAYVLQGTTSLVPPIAWTAISTNNGTGQILTISVPIEKVGEANFFRIKAD